MQRSDLVAALGNSNVRAFLQVIRTGEGALGDLGYHILFGGSHFDSLADHPRIKFYEKHDEFIRNGKVDYTTAAGAYQITETTWNGLVKLYAFESFAPDCQDEAAVALIAGRSALQDVINGNFETAVRKCAKEWASLPFSPYGQPVMTMQKALKVYQDAGGVLAAAAQGEPTVFPFIAAALPALINAAPDLIRVFGDSPIAERNAQAAEKVVEIAKTVTGTTNSEEAVTKIEADPAMAQAFREQARKDFLEIEAMADKRVDAARQFNKDEAPIFKSKWANVKFVHILSLIVVLGALLGIGYVLTTSTETAERAMALQALLLTGFAGVMAYWTGSSSGSDKKTDLMKREEA